jgi:hypothetical protein
MSNFTIWIGVDEILNSWNLTRDVQIRDDMKLKSWMNEFESWFMTLKLWIHEDEIGI